MMTVKKRIWKSPNAVERSMKKIRSKNFLELNESKTRKEKLKNSSKSLEILKFLQKMTPIFCSKCLNKTRSVVQKHAVTKFFFPKRKEEEFELLKISKLEIWLLRRNLTPLWFSKLWPNMFAIIVSIWLSGTNKGNRQVRFWDVHHVNSQDTAHENVRKKLGLNTRKNAWQFGYVHNW